MGGCREFLLGSVLWLRVVAGQREVKKDQMNRVSVARVNVVVSSQPLWTNVEISRQSW